MVWAQIKFQTWTMKINWDLAQGTQFKNMEIKPAPKIISQTVLFSKPDQLTPSLRTTTKITKLKQVSWHNLIRQNLIVQVSKHRQISIWRQGWMLLSLQIVSQKKDWSWFRKLLRRGQRLFRIHKGLRSTCHLKTTQWMAQWTKLRCSTEAPLKRSAIWSKWREIPRISSRLDWLKDRQISKKTWCSEEWKS